MKQYFFFFLIVLVSSSCMIACTKSNNNNTIYHTSKGRIKGRPSNSTSSFDVSGVNTIILRDITSDTLPVIKMDAIIHQAYPYQAFGITLRKIKKPGIYYFGSTNANAYYTLGSLASEYYITDTSSTAQGSVIVTAISDTALHGTYSVTVTNTNKIPIIINDGSFSCTF